MPLGSLSLPLVSWCLLPQSLSQSLYHRQGSTQELINDLPTSPGDTFRGGHVPSSGISPSLWTSAACQGFLAISGQLPSASQRALPEECSEQLSPAD